MIGSDGYSIDRLFQSRIWSWLIAHPDVIIDTEKYPRSISLEEAEALTRTSDTPIISTTEADTPPAGSQTSEFRVRVNQERIWNALTGHPVDFSRCPRLEFACLSGIASRRQEGIYQTDLIRLTGQDKRSLPGRTDALAKRGYISKNVVFVRGQRTSHLLLRRYVKADSALTRNGRVQVKTINREGVGLVEVLEAEPLVRAIISELKKRGVISQNDLKWKLVGPSILVLGLGSSDALVGLGHCQFELAVRHLQASHQEVGTHRLCSTNESRR